jgi:HlyD family secretion protein
MDRIVENKHFIKPKYWSIIITSIVIILGIMFLLLADHTKSMTIAKDKVTIETVFKGQFNDYIQLSGQAAPIKTIYLDAVEGGRVEEILIEEGSMVKKGDVILKMANNDLHLNILNSEAQLAEKSNFLREVRLSLEQEKLANEREILNEQYQLVARKRAYEQNKALYKNKLIAEDVMLRSEEDYNLAHKMLSMLNKQRQQDSIYRKIQIDELSDNLLNMRRNMTLVKQQLDFLNIKATVDGQLGLLDAETGQNINRGQRIGQINMLSSLKVEAEIDEHFIDRIKVGLPAQLERSAKASNLLVKKVYPEVHNGKFKVDLVFVDALPDNIRIGQTYYFKLELGQPLETLQIARGGFYQSTGGQSIFVLDKSEKVAVKRAITIGKQNPEFYEILSGLAPGEKVITSGYEMFDESKKVQKLIFK